MTRPASNTVALLSAAVLTAWLYPAASADQSLVEIYKSGKVRFIPEMTITAAAMGGKDFLLPVWREGCRAGDDGLSGVYRPGHFPYPR